MLWGDYKIELNLFKYNLKLLLFNSEFLGLINIIIFLILYELYKFWLNLINDVIICLFLGKLLNIKLNIFFLLFLLKLVLLGLLKIKG